MICFYVHCWFFRPVLTFVLYNSGRVSGMKVWGGWSGHGSWSAALGRRYHHQLVQGLTHNGDCCLSVRKGPEILGESYRHPAALNTGLFFVEDFYNTENSSVIQLESMSAQICLLWSVDPGVCSRWESFQINLIASTLLYFAPAELALVIRG